MPKYSNRTDIGIKKQKPFTGNTKKVMDFANEYVVPKTPADVAMYLIPYGKVARAVAGITKKGAKYVGKAYRNIGK
jgi:hypothetical protein